MKKNYFILFGPPFLIMTVVILSCGKDYDLTNVNSQNPTSYILIREAWSGPTTNGQSFAFFYNNDHLVSRIERYQWGNGGSSQTWYDTAYYTFEYANGLCRKWRMVEGGGDSYFIYEYNKKDLPIKRTCYYSDNTIQSYTFYKYDNADNLIEKVDSSNAVNFRTTYDYDNDRNLVSSINYILWSSPQQKSKYEWSDFDGKVNFIKSVNGLPVTAAYDNNYHSYSYSSPNNFRVEKHYPQINIDQSFDFPDSYGYSYTYNEEGLPIQMIYGPWTVTFTYEKYK